MPGDTLRQLGTAPPGPSGDPAPTRAAILASTRLLAGLTAEQLDALERVCREQRFEPGEFLLREGAPDPVVHVLLDGRAEVIKHTSLGGQPLRIAQVELCGGPLRHVAARAAAPADRKRAQAAVALLTNVGVLLGSAIAGAVWAWSADERLAVERAMAVRTVLMLAAFLPAARLRAHRRAGVTSAAASPRWRSAGG